MQTRLNCRELASEFLLRYRVTPHATTNTPTAQLLLGRVLRIQLDLIHPDPNNIVRAKQEIDKNRFDSRAKDRHFENGEPVFARNFAGRLRWKPGIVLGRTGPVSYDVQVGQNVEHRHATQLRTRLLDMPAKSNKEEVEEQVQHEFDEQPLVALPAELVPGTQVLTDPAPRFVTAPLSGLVLHDPRPPAPSPPAAPVSTPLPPSAPAFAPVPPAAAAPARTLRDRGFFTLDLSLPTSIPVYSLNKQLKR